MFSRSILIGILFGWVVAIVDPYLLHVGTSWARAWATPPDLLAREGLAWLGTAGLVFGVAIGWIRVRRTTILGVIGLVGGLLYAAAPTLTKGLPMSATWIAMGIVLGVAVAVLLIGLDGVTARVSRRAVLSALVVATLTQAIWWVSHPRDVDRVQFPASAAVPRVDDRPNLLLIVLDTVRADHLALYGGPRVTTPHLDRFAERATVFEDCMSPAPWTLPTHASLFTGLPATVHGCNGLRQRLDPRWDTLAEHLHASGYQTLGLSSNPFLDAARGFDQGFDLWRNPISGPISGRRPLVRLLRDALGAPDRADDAEATAVNRRLAHWFGHEVDSDRPWFVFVNHIEAHAPYDPPSRTLRFTDDTVRRRWRARDQHYLMQTQALTGRTMLDENDLRELRDLYDEEIAFVDAKVGALLDHLERSGELDRTVVAITSDHGEQFGEHGLFDHVYSVDEPLLRVPLVVRWPGQTQAVRDPLPRQTHDLFPTLLTLAGIDDVRPVGSDARDLRESVAPDRERLAALESPLISNVAAWAARIPDADYRRFLRDRHALRRGAWKLTTAADEDPRLYDVHRDPQELVDKARTLPDSVTVLERRLEAHREALEQLRLPPGETGTTMEVDPEQLERLRALGYVN